MPDTLKYIALRNIAGITCIDGRTQRAQPGAHFLAGIFITSTLNFLQHEAIQLVGQVDVAGRHARVLLNNGSRTVYTKVMSITSSGAIFLIVIRRFQASAVLFLLAVSGVSTFGQVQVTLTTNQSSYLAGEPIFVVATVTNAGTEPITYSELNAHASLIVVGERKRQTPNLYGCFGPGSGGNQGGGVYDTPRMRPGQTVTIWFLLKGYDLRAGDYVLRVSGNAGVQWKYVVFGSPAGPLPVPKHLASDPVDGGIFDESMRLTVRESTEAQLRQRFAPYVADAEGWDMEKRSRARKAISEMAPAFLKKTLLGFADQPEWARFAVEGLGRIPTDDSRSDLISLFDASVDLRLRSLIVQKLAEIGTAREMAFFASLLPGRSAALDDEARKFAALGLGRVGGSEAVTDLAEAPRDRIPRSAHRSPWHWEIQGTVARSRR